MRTRYLGAPAYIVFSMPHPENRFHERVSEALAEFKVNGATVYDALGIWEDSRLGRVHEKSATVMICDPGMTWHRLTLLAERLRQWFGQEAVLIVFHNESTLITGDIHEEIP